MIVLLKIGNMSIFCFVIFFTIAIDTETEMLYY